MIVGISGIARAGKDACADALVEKMHFVRVAYGDAVKRAAREAFDFSEEQLWGDLKDVPDPRYPISSEYMAAYEREKALAAAATDAAEADQHLLSALSHEKEGWLVPRRTLTGFGDAARQCYSNTWVDRTLGIVDKLLHENPHGTLQYRRASGVVFVGQNNPLWAVVIPDCRYKNEMDAIRLRQGRIIRVRRANAGLEGRAGDHSSETAQQEIPDLYFDAVIENDGTLEELHEKVLKLVACWK